MGHQEPAGRAVSTDRRLWVLVGSWVSVAVLTITVSVLFGGGTAAVDSPLALSIALGVAGVVVGIVHVSVQVHSTREATNLNELAYVPMMVLLPPSWAVLTALAAATVAEAILTRGQGRKAAFNVSWQVVGVGAGAWLYHVLAPPGLDTTPWTLLAAALAVGAFPLANLAAMSGIGTILGRRRWLRALREEVSLRLPADYGSALLGLLAAVLIVHAPWALPLVVVPVLWHAGHLQARSADRQQFAAERTRFERTVAESSDAIALLDGDLRIEVWNPQMIALTGVAADDALGSTLAQLGWSRLDPVATAGTQETRLEVGELTLDVRVALIHQPPTSVRVSVFGPLPEGGEGRVIAVRDVTREAELSRIREDLVARVSHEMRTPLTTVVGFLETLVTRWDGLDDSKRQHLLTVAWRASGRLQRLVSNLMVWARIESRLEPDGGAGATHVRHVLDEVLATMPLEVDAEIDIDEEAVAAIDAQDLQTILANLVDNAAIYGAPPIAVTATRAAGWVRIFVTDHGEGLPSAFEAQLYEPFAQASEGLQRTARGLGMGLAVSRALAIQAGGDVTYEKLEPSGTRFTVALPAADSTRDPHP